MIMAKRLLRVMAITLFLGGVLVIVAGALVLQGRKRLLAGGQETLLEEADRGLRALERLYLQTYLSARADELSRPAGKGTTAVTFVISPGETAEQIGANLVSEGLLDDQELFTRYARYQGLDNQLEAGEFLITPPLTIPELTATLVTAFAQDVELRFLEGWRLEEMVAYLDATRPARIEGKAFRAIVTQAAPFPLANYDFLASLPAGASLEGFLFPDTYRVPTDADAAYLVGLMLENFGRRVTPEMRQSFGVQGLSLREALTLASIVEREAVVVEERPTIASVFYNRIRAGTRLEADPTVQYALGYDATSGKWWKSPLTLDDLKLDSPYNTYQVPGLPPGPIANPGLSSLEAVSAPDETPYLFFVADCNAETRGAHTFSITFDEHLAKVNRCR
jgi:UPF0755 protein